MKHIFYCLFILGVTFGCNTVYADISDAQFLNTLCRGQVTGTAIVKYSNGVIRAKVTCLNGVADGIGRTFYTSGAMKSKIYFKAGIADGITKNFYPTGNLNFATYHTPDRPAHTIKEYSEPGNRILGFSQPVAQLPTAPKPVIVTTKKYSSPNYTSNKYNTSGFGIEFAFWLIISAGISMLLFTRKKSAYYDTSTSIEPPSVPPIAPAVFTPLSQSSEQGTTPIPPLSISKLASEITGYHPNANEAARLFGTRIHNELHRFYVSGDATCLISPMAKKLAGLLPRRPNMKSEFKVPNGICDIVVIENKKCTYLADFKTSPTMSPEYLEYCQCQLNLYREALCDMNFDVSDIVMEIIYPGGKIQVLQKNYCRNIVFTPQEYKNEYSDWQGWHKYYNELYRGCTDAA